MNVRRLDPGAEPFTAAYPTGDDEESFAALPAAALGFLISLASSIGAKRVFEFGSGKSTAAFVGAGLEVTCLEHSEYWMNETLARIHPGRRPKLASHVVPLATCWCGGVPMQGWPLARPWGEALRAADLVLVDSPCYVPYREHTLMQALSQTRAVVVIDDTRIPTVARFCDRLAAANSRQRHFYEQERLNSRSPPQPLLGHGGTFQ